jgi:hypothetical protein
MIVGNSNFVVISVDNKKKISMEILTDGSARQKKIPRHQVTDEIFLSVKFNGNYRRNIRR